MQTRSKASYLITLIMTCSSFCFLIDYTLGRATQESNDVFLFLFSLAGAMIVLTAFSFITLVLPNRNHQILLSDLNARNRTILLAIILAGWTLVLCNMYVHTLEMENAPTVFCWQSLRYPYLILIVTCLLSILYFLQHKFQFLDVKERNNKVFWLVSILAALLVTFFCWFPSNLSSFFTIYNQDAYFNSIYNAYYNEPYSALNYGTYGHYAIILSALLKILGLSHFPELMAVLCGVSFLCYCYCADKLIKNQWIKIMTVIASLCMCAGNYIGYVCYQGYPHRFLFIALFCAIFTWGVYKEKLRKIPYQIFLFVLADFAILWNLETGLVCAVATSCLLIISTLNRKGIRLPSLLIRTLVYGVSCFASFLAAWGMTTLWNLVNGGEPLSFRLFVVPILSLKPDVDFVRGLQIPLQSGNSLWLHITLIFIFFITICFLKTRLLRGGGSTNAQISCAGLAILGLGSLIFFVNRAGFGGLYIVFFVTCLLIGVLAQWATDWCVYYPPKSAMVVLARSLKIFSSSVLFLLCIMTIVLGIQFQPAQIQSIPEQVTKENAVLSEIRQTVPPNTNALGNGTAYIYSQLGWENSIRVCDAPAIGLSQAAWDLYATIIQKNDSPIFINPYEQSLDFPYTMLYLYRNYDIIQTFEINGFTYLYAIPKSYVE